MQGMRVPKSRNVWQSKGVLRQEKAEEGSAVG